MNITERIERTKAAKAAKKTRHQAQSIRIDDNWTIIRLDERNWSIRKNGKLPDNQENFYGTLISAFKGLPATMLHSEAKNDVQNVLRSHLAVSERIERALEHLPHGI